MQKIRFMNCSRLCRRKERQYAEVTEQLSQLKQELEQKELQCKELEQELLLKERIHDEVVTNAKSMKQLVFEESAEKALLEEQVEQLEKDNTILETNIRAITDKYMALEAELVAQKAVSRQLEVQVQVTQKSCQDKNDELERTQLMNRDLIQSLGEFEVSLVSANGMISQLRAQLEASQNKAESLEVQIKQHDIANNVLKSQIATMTDESNKCQDQLKDKIKRLQEKYCEDLQSVKEALFVDRQQSNAQISELSLRLERNQTLNCQMKEETKKLLADKERLQHESRKEISRLQELVKTTEADLQAKLTAAYKKTESLKQQLASAEKEKKRLHADVESLRQSLEMNEEVSQCQEAMVQECQTKLARLEDQVRDLESKKESLEDELNRVCEERSDLQEAALEERAEFDRMMGEMSDKIQQLEDTQANTQETEE
nr:hypothetical protein BaRGS_031246 [Batillaria attramentaria]